ncbi:hypothetical protein V6N12_074454 [Hibiscus sabdariffa]|uniref:Uncharacterized protein n=1 Tax=Hibiscus sabdariffa TaxID=183260 RepID=A0ABR2BL99_9ROSI
MAVSQPPAIVGARTEELLYTGNKCRHTVDSSSSKHWFFRFCCVLLFHVKEMERAQGSPLFPPPFGNARRPIMPWQLYINVRDGTLMPIHPGK